MDRLCINSVAGTLRLRNSGLIALDFFDDVNRSDEDGLTSESDVGVEVPDVRFMLTVQHMSMLLYQVDTLASIEFWDRSVSPNT